MSQRKHRSSKKDLACINHPANLDTKECERCHNYFCSECYIEDWHETFFQQFVGQKREMVKKIYCVPCQKRVIRVRMIAYIGLLVLFLSPVLLWALIAIF